jgi:seryl-tRNA synthetase
VAVQYDAQDFYEGLVKHRLIIPVGVAGAFGRGSVFEDVLERFNALVSKVALADNAEVYTFPPIISRQILEKVHYLDSFPHLCGAVYSFFGKDLQAKALSQKVNEGKPWGDMLQMTEVTLNPAACYPVYPSFTGVVPVGGRTVSMLNWVYRHEPSPEPTRMQSFRVREFVKAGSPDEVIEWRDRWLQRGLTLLQSLELPAHSDVAADPFFGRGGKMMAANQREQKLKFEVLVPVISAQEPTAVCSFNFHQEHFGSTFEIRTPDGKIANTACLGFGLERIVMALFKTHGFQVDAWPDAVRQQLWA